MLECMLEKEDLFRDAASLGSLAGRQADGWKNGRTDGCHLKPFWIFDAGAEGGAYGGGGKVI